MRLNIQIAVFLLVLLFLLVRFGSCQWKRTIYVDSNNGTNNDSCWYSNSTEQACQSLDFASRGVVNSTQIVLLRGLHNVTTVVKFSGSAGSRLEDIEIRGHDVTDETKVVCSEQDPTGAGFLFVFVSKLTISDLVFEFCGTVVNSTTGSVHSTLKFRSALYILNCTTVTVRSTSFVDGTGIGLVLYDTNGDVSITNSNFSRNAVPEDEHPLYSGGGGLHIEHTYCTPGRLGEMGCDYEHNPFANGSIYTIYNCHFVSNNATTRDNDTVAALAFDKRADSQRLGKGGGIAITLKGSSAFNTFEISNCNFTGNSATTGGGLDISLQDFAKSNTLLLQNCTFDGNTAPKNDGGATRIGFEFYSCDCVTNNTIEFLHTHFTNNTAKWGGAIEFFSSRTKEITLPNAIRFTDCHWMKNVAEMAAAVDLAPDAWSTLTDGYLPIPYFANCSFIENHISTTQAANPSGVLFIDTFTVELDSSAFFINNTGTAVNANAGRIKILNDTQAFFIGNQGAQGGAIALGEFSVLHTSPGSELTFINNNASDVGGAIFKFSADESDFLYSRSCFISYSDPLQSPDDWDVRFYFENNTALQYGNSIYATSLLPCARAASVNETINVSHVFQWKTFQFSGSKSSGKYNIATEPSTLHLGTSNLQVPPGQIHTLDITAMDELNNVVDTIYRAYISKNTDNVKISSSAYISDQKIQIQGTINSTFQMNLQTIGAHKISTSLKARLTQCPPGYVYSDSHCMCSADTEYQQYSGILGCDTSKFQGLLSKGFWAGCVENQTFVTAECPLGYCFYHDSKPEDSFIPLPPQCEDLENFLCSGQNRTGLLCGRCEGNLTVYYHSQRFHCGECDYGYTGLLFYILSELIPVTIFFLVILWFNINLTSGLANSFIFFAQVLDFFQVNSLGLYSLPPGVDSLSDIYRFIFGFLNLDFFRLDSLGFCLWEGATVLDVLVFKYITTAYAILLLVLLVVFKRWFHCNQACYCPKRDSTIHCISAFLIISYAQCAKVSFQILTRVELLGEGSATYKQAVFLSGETQFFSRDHLPYAIPAIFCLLTICTITPALLIAYPAVNRALALCMQGNRRGGENEGMETSDYHPGAKCCQVGRLKPLIDSFQGCYKDHLRFFAGLYFVYRLAISAAFAFTTSGVQLYVCLEIVLVAMLAFHAIAQPYEKRYYNIVDAIMFANLAVINGISLYDYFLSLSSHRHNSTLDIFSSIQVALIFLPLIYMVIFLTLKFAARYNSRVRNKLRSANRYIPLLDGKEEDENIGDENVFDEDHLPARLFEDPLPRNPQRRASNYGAIQRVTL